MNKVSIIIPVYNGENYIERTLKSILNQTYKDLELIMVDDGSTDKTKEIINEYKENFNELHIKMIYMYQENSGAASAINKALKVFSGNYLTWMDADDVIRPLSIEKRVNYLIQNPEYAMVRTNGVLINDLSREIQGYFAKNVESKEKEEIFLDLILENNVWMANGCYMMKSEVLKERLQNMKIYENI